MIKSLSPYYLTIPFVSPLTGATCTTFTLKIYVWDGLKINVPATPVYSVTKNNPTGSTGNDKINISRLVNDYINFIPAVGVATGLIDAENQRWCKTSIVYTTENVLDTDVEQLEEVSLVLKGYSYGMDGENVGLPSNRILLDGTEFKVDRNGVFNLPILIDETIDNSEIVLNSVAPTTPTGYFTYDFTINFTPTELVFQHTGIDNPIWLGQIISNNITSPQDVNINRLNFQTRIKAYNPLTGNYIFSNIIEVNI